MDEPWGFCESELQVCDISKQQAAAGTQGTLSHTRILARTILAATGDINDMRKNRTTTDKTKPRIIMPDQIDLSTHQALDISFTDHSGDELLNIQFRRETDGSTEFVINIIGPTGDVSSAITLFDLEVG